MSELGGFDSGDPFVPRPEVFAAGGGGEFESTNLCRAAALAVLLRLNTQELVQPLSGPLEELGFTYEAIIDLGNQQRLAAALTSDWFAGDGSQVWESERRQLNWQSLNESVDALSAVRFLIGVLGSDLERESAAAAAALWRVLSDAVEPDRWALADALTSIDPRLRLGMQEWNGEMWRSVFATVIPEGRTETMEERLSALQSLVVVRLRLARQSSDLVTRSLALALRLNSPGPALSGPSGGSMPTPPGALVVSTMVHGTRGWKGDWWRPKGGFHQFIAHNHRPNLYGRGARFSWSGAYSQSQRIIAAEDLVDWTQEVAPNGLQSVFAHSYGGEVAAMAAMAGASTQELVLLSAPATGFVNAAVGSVARVIDVRLPLDPVLCIANTSQRLAPARNVTEVLLPWYLMHGASHDEDVWTAHDVATQADL